MTHHFDPPGWLEALSWLMLVAAFTSAAVMLFDILVRGHRQKMAIMNAVYPVTALYWGPVAVWFYFRYGRQKSKKVMERHEQRRQARQLAGVGARNSGTTGGDGGDDHGSLDGSDRLPMVSKAVSHCGAGCTLGDIAGEWLVHALGLTFLFAGVAGSLVADYVFAFAFAWLLGVVFQYFTIVPMRDDLGPVRGVWAAIKADTLSIVAFQVGLFAAMAVYQLVIFHPGLAKTTATYWFMMQLAMIIGFFTAIPANLWLIEKGWKEAM